LGVALSWLCGSVVCANAGIATTASSTTIINIDLFIIFLSFSY
jgi:hypothetical protein